MNSAEKVSSPSDIRLAMLSLSRLLVETAILLAASLTNAATALRDTASVCKVDIDAITLKVKQEFAAKEKAKRGTQAGTKPTKKTAA